MERIVLSQKEKEMVREWLQDEEWTELEEYRNDQEYLACVQDIFEHPVFQSMAEYYQHGHTTCKDHCIRVSYMSYKMCRKRGWDYHTTARAALLHDLFLYDWHTHAKETGEHFHGFTHPRVAMNNAVKYFDIGIKEQDMILRHMWPLTPVPPKSREGYVIIYADKFCGLVEVGLRAKEWFLCSLRPNWGRR